MVAETTLSADDLIAPLFIREGIDSPEPISSLLGSGAWDPDGIVQVALREARSRFGDSMVLIADLCVDEYTISGHCGVVDGKGSVDNDKTLEIYQRIAVAQANAGADIVAPSGMMDGQVAAIRHALDEAGHVDIAILAYAAKYASAFYGPFRDAVDVTIADGGDRKGYQQDPRNGREAMEEIKLDLAEGADMIMVKPAMAYLDIVLRARLETNAPIAAYHVSGEYAMLGGTPYFVASGEGPYVTDVEGKTYIDFVQSYGPGILGHAHPKVIEAITKAASAGTSYGAPTLGEVELAEEIARRIPGMEMMRMTSSGTEAAMSAIRLARGATGRDTIIKFAGCYHGHTDSLLVAGGSGVANQGLVGSDGVPEGAVADTIVAPFNVIPEIDDTIAVVAVEPVAANMGLVPPSEGFLRGLREACDNAGAMLLFDEVITGFRLAHGGATEWFGVQPDVWAFGKVIGGGLPVGLYGGSREVMQHISPLGGVYQGGTLSGNPLATAAGLATLEVLDRDAYVELERIATRLAVGMRSAFADAGVDAIVPTVGPIVGLFFGTEAPTNFDEVKVLAENGVYTKFFHECLSRGVALAPGPYEILFPGLAHSDAVIDEAVSVMAEAAQAIA